MTFTTRSGETRCDSCQGVVGNGWRAMHGHICPRTVPDPFAKTCELPSCAAQLVRRDDETPSNFARRRFCDKSCANKKRVPA